MKSLKSKFIGFVGGLGAFCVLCCTLPILGLVGLGAYEAIFCENLALQIGGALLALSALGYFILKKRSTCAVSCATGCGCKTV